MSPFLKGRDPSHPLGGQCPHFHCKGIPTQDLGQAASCPFLQEEAPSPSYPVPPNTQF